MESSRLFNWSLHSTPTDAIAPVYAHSQAKSADWHTLSENNLSTGVFTSDRLQVLNCWWLRQHFTRKCSVVCTVSRPCQNAGKESRSANSSLAAGDCWTSTNRSRIGQSEANYRNLLQTANSVIIRYDPQGRIDTSTIMGWNFGYEEHEILGELIWNYPHRNLWTRYETLSTFTSQSSITRKARWKPVSRRAARLPGRIKPSSMNRRVVEILSLDMTSPSVKKQKKHYNAVKPSSAISLKTRTASSAALGWIILDANQRFANLFGFDSPEEIIGLNTPQAIM